MSRRTLFAALLALAVAAPAVRAQEANSGNNNSNSNSGDRNRSSSDRGSDRGGDRGRGGFDPARMAEMMKERMGATDDEWKVIEPKLQKVRDAQRDMMGGMFGGFRRRDDNNSSSTSSAMQNASKELRDVLDKKDASADEINQKLTAYREARNKAKQTLAVAQKDLKDVLTARQEAVLVSMSMLD